MTDTIWEAELDNKYDCKVTRVDEYTGVLSVIDIETGNKLLEENVTLAYGAQFGADMVDIMEWEDRIIEIIDGI